MDIHADIRGFLDPCMDLLWNLGPGEFFTFYDINTEETNPLI